VARGLSCKPITVILYPNFQIFVTMVTGWSETNYIAQLGLHSLTPEQPLYLVKNRGRISYTRRVIIIINSSIKHHHLFSKHMKWVHCKSIQIKSYGRRVGTGVWRTEVTQRGPSGTATRGAGCSIGESTIKSGKPEENRCRLHTQSQRGDIGREMTVERVVG